MAETTPAEKKKLDEEAEQTAAKDEPMGSVAAAVPRDAGSAAPAHQGGHATVVAGSESHKAEDPKRQTPATGKPKR